MQVYMRKSYIRHSVSLSLIVIVNNSKTNKMKKVTKYKHNGVDVFTFKAYKGMYKDVCLCINGCANFKPNSKENCVIAQSNFENCVKYKTVQPVTECPNFKEPRLDNE